VRNPLYLGDLLIFSAYGLMLTPLLAVVFALYHVVRTYRLILYEESQMLARWGRPFEEYCRRTPRLVPRIAAPPPGPVNWREGLAASTMWTGFAAGYIASWITGTLWALAPIEAAGFLLAWWYFARRRRAAREAVDA
jgi:protein-S-isoprenylcysteine O-methyltransferase Ste14